MRFLKLSFLLFPPLSLSVSTPPPTGPLPVGVLDLQLTDHSRTEIFSPAPQPRRLVLSLYYPSVRTNARPREYMPTSVGQAIENYYPIPKNTFPRLVTRSVTNARPKLPSDFQVLIFSPGFQSSRYLYSTLCEDLASWGFVVASVDHPYDAIAVEFPENKELVPMYPITLNSSILQTLIPFYTQRADDVAFLAREMDGILSSKLKARLKSKKIGAFGHSLGGSTAAGAMLRSKLIVSGMNLDGLQPNSSARPDAISDLGRERKFLLMGTENHTSATEPTWPTWKRAQTGYLKEWAMKDTGHLVYGDTIAIIAPEILDIRKDINKEFVDANLGTIDGKRALDIQRAWIRDWWEWTMRKGDGKLVRGKGGDKWPEMFVVT